ncbi:hypothetical protein BJX63DRAFT_425293 [Aspergillus granulosus]|uniref:AAA+ ATPase domain-containing protein n=1 Tax=Aspergillus granulosus TaxID=176169 RepID=A0ABR4GWG1_9EURO
MRPKSRDDFAIAIICALPLEADAVEALFDQYYDRLGKYYGKQRGDSNAYINGRIGKHDVVLCYMPEMGKGSAASVASGLQVSYTGIELALVVGICGGAPSPPDYREIFLGDVIISDSVIEYDFGRQYPSGFQRKAATKDMLGRPGRAIRTLLNGLRAENARSELQSQTRQYLLTLQQTGTRWLHPGASDILFKSSYLHKHHFHAPAGCSCSRGDSSEEICEEALGKSCDDLECDKSQAIRCREISDSVQASVYIGPVASADTVMKSGRHRDEIVRKENVIGFEMEGAGVWDSVPCLIIKGVCDYADSHKCKLWQAYAAATGASAAKAFLEYWMPANHKDAGRNRHLMIPFARNPHFVGRQEEIQKIEDLISVPDGPKKLAITGLGGVGKTQIALELAYRMQDREPECSIFWIPCTSYEAVEQAFMSIAQRVGLHNLEPAEVKARVKTFFRQANEKWTLIFDNADELDMWTKGSKNTPPLRDFLPFNRLGYVILTTRNRKLAVKLASSVVIHVPELDEKTGIEFLRKSLIQKSLVENHHATIALLEQLTFLPLAITQAAAYINENGIGISEYLLLLQEEEEANVVELLSEDFDDDGRYKDIQNPVAMTWIISFRQVQKLDQLAADYLALMSCVDPRNIPKSFLPQSTSRKTMIDALGLLSAYSFITTQPENGSITIHRLVHLATRNWIKKEAQSSLYIQKAADRLSEGFPYGDHTNRQIWREYLPHALFLFEKNEFQERQEQYIDCIEKVGASLHSDGRYNEAGDLLIRVMETRKKALGLENPNTLTSINNLASTYQDQGRWKEAEELFVQASEIQKQVLGPEHPNSLISMNNLASTYQRQGQWKEAEVLLVRVMDTRKQVLGTDHPDTLRSMNNLASIYRDQGRWKEAEELFVQASEIQKQVLGPDHPDTLGQGRWKEAEELFVQVSEAQKQVLGPEHPDTLLSMHNIASAYLNQRRWKEAEELFMQVIEMQKQVLGPEHPITLISMSNFAHTLKGLGKITSALSLIKKCAELCTTVLGSDHPVSILSFNMLRKWETGVHQLPESQQQRTSAEIYPALPITTYVGDRFELDPKPVIGGKRRAFMKFLRKR